jgi:hypothetical protein
MQKFNKTGIAQRSILFNNSSRNYPVVKSLLEKNKKLRRKLDSTVIPVNNSLLRYIKSNGNKISIHEKAGGEYEKLGYRTSNSKSSINLDKNLLGIDFRMVNNNVISYNKERFSPEKRIVNDSPPIDVAKFNTMNLKPITTTTTSNRRDSNFQPNVVGTLVPTFDFIDKKNDGFKNKRSNSIIVVPEKAIDNVLNSLRDVDPVLARAETTINRRQQLEVGKNKFSNDIFAVDSSFFNNNNHINDTNLSFNFVNHHSPNRRPSEQPSHIKSLDDMLLNPSFFEEVNSVKPKVESKFRQTTTSDDKFMGVNDISSISYMNDTTNRSMDLSTILMNNTQIVEEDKFNPNTIKKKIRGAILVSIF